jgi:hypothetical protein
MRIKGRRQRATLLPTEATESESAAFAEAENGKLIHILGKY